MKRGFPSLALSGLGLIGLSAVSGQKPVTLHSTQPNIILILADDMGYSDLGCFGSEISTPNLDRLASTGIRMTQFYNASRSCPTRASLLTGLYQHQAGVGDMVSDLGYPSYQGYLNDHCITLAEALGRSGYNTYMSGKWHVGNRDGVHPMDRGFDRFFGSIDGGGSYFQRISFRPGRPVLRWMMDRADFEPPDTGFYLTDAIAGNAVKFLESENGKQGPFFLYLAFTAPHWPLHALPEDIAKYRGKYLKGWDYIRESRYRKMLATGLFDPSVKLSPRYKGAVDWLKLTDEEKDMWDLRMAVYAAMIDRMDQGIGKVLAQVEKMGESANTLIVFLSDNGGSHEEVKNKAGFIPSTGTTGTPGSFDSYEIPWANASNTPFRMFKHWVHEGGISTPFIACFPREIKAGQISSQTGHIIDLMPTFLDYASGSYRSEFQGNEIPPEEGISLRQAFRGKPVRREKPLFWEHEGNRAVRDGDWKLVSLYNTATKNFEEWELYNIKEDRSELNDLSHKFPEIKFRLVEAYCDWAERVDVISRETIDNKKKK